MEGRNCYPKGNRGTERTTPGLVTQPQCGAGIRTWDLALVLMFPLPTPPWHLGGSGSVNHTSVPCALECLQCRLQVEESLESHREAAATGRGLAA